MSLKVNKEVIYTYLEELKNEQNVVSWTDFVIAAKNEILASFNYIDNERIIKSQWIKKVTQVAKEFNMVLYKADQDNWHIIDKAKSTNTTTSSDITTTNSTKSSTTTTTTSSTKSSSLGTILQNNKKKAILNIYSKMENNKKWKLSSGRYVEDVMQQLVQCLNFEHPSCNVVLDISDENWGEGYFTESEIEEIKGHSNIDYHQFPAQMEQFLNNVPKSNDIDEVFDYIRKQDVNPKIDPDLYWLKSNIEPIAYMFVSQYLPITDQNERDLMRRLWMFIDTAFDSSVLKFRSEKPCYATKIMKNKKRKISAVEQMEKQSHPQIPDMLMFYQNLEFGMAEIAKEDANTKELNEGGIKCQDIMNAMFINLINLHPSLQHEMTITGFLISGLKLTPVELSNPFGYVKLIKKGKPLYFPEHSMSFSIRLFPLLKLIWVSKLTMEARLKQVLLNPCT